MKYSLLIIFLFLSIFSFNSFTQNNDKFYYYKLYNETFFQNDSFVYNDDELITNQSYSDEYYKKSLELFEKGKYDSALIYANFDSTASSFISQNSSEFSRSLLLLAKIYTKLSNHNLAINALKKALEIEKNKQDLDKTKVKTILLDLSTLLIITSKYKDAEKILEELIPICKETELKDTLSYISALNNLAILSKQMANYKRADSTYIELIAITKSKYGAFSNEYARVLSNYASLCNAQERNDEAEVLYKEIIKIDKNINNEFSKSHANTLNNLASLYLQTGRLVEAETYLKRAINIYENLKDSKSYQYYSLLFNYARYQDYSGQLDLAEKNYLKVLSGFEATLGNKNIQITAILNNLSVLYIKKNNISEAEEMISRVIAIRLELLGNKHPSYSASLLNLSDLYRLKGQYAKADSILELCLEIEGSRESSNQPSKAVILSKKGILSLDMGKYLQAEVFFRSAININELNFAFPLPRMVTEYTNLGIALFHQNKKKEAKDCFLKALNTVQYLVKNYFPYCSEYEKAVYYDTLYSNLQKVYNFAFKITNDFPDLLDAVSNSILAHKAILFNYLLKLRKQVVNSGDQNLISKFKKWENLKNDYAKKYRSLSLNSKDFNSLDSTIQVINNLEKEITSEVGLSGYNFDNFDVHCNEISKLLKNKEEYVQLIRVKKFGRAKNAFNPEVSSFCFNDSSFYIALVIHPKYDKSIHNLSNSIDIVPLENGFDIDSLAPALYNNSIQLHKSKKVDIVQININQMFLYSILWEKISEKLKNPNVVYFIPDGSYNLINLNTLLNPKNKKYLIEETDFRLNSSVGQFLEQNNRKKEKKIANKSRNVAVLFGDPRFYSDSSNITLFVNQFHDRIAPENTSEYMNFLISRFGLVTLPGTRKEIQSISKIFEKKNWTVFSYLGEEAKEDSLKIINSPKVLHIATHGLFLRDRNNINSYQDSYSFENNPLLKSYLLFANIEKIFDDSASNSLEDDGLLSAYEATNLNLTSTELVVLSACETGLGTIRNGEGVYGLQRAFQLAGAKSVMMSLWNVSDLATQELMSNFYTLWLIKGKNKHQAFRDAQLEIKDKYPNFYFWGAFVMVGE